MLKQKRSCVIMIMLLLSAVQLMSGTLKEERNRELARWRNDMSDEQLSDKVTGYWEYYGASSNGTSYYSCEELSREDAAKEMMSSLSISDAAFFVTVGSMYKGTTLKISKDGKLIDSGTEYKWSVKDKKFVIEGDKPLVTNGELKVTDDLLLIGQKEPFIPMVYLVFKKKPDPSDMPEGKMEKLEQRKKKREELLKKKRQEKESTEGEGK